METEKPQLHYAGFGIRLAAQLLDAIFLFPLTAVAFCASRYYVLFPFVYILPRIIFNLYYNVHLVQRFGGTPGKLIMRLRITRHTGDAIGFREASLRYAPEFIFGLLISLALLLAHLHKIRDVEYDSLAAPLRKQRSREFLPSWHQPLVVANGVWILSECIVLLTNHKRRALHDFIAGTVVVCGKTLCLEASKARFDDSMGAAKQDQVDRGYRQ